MTIYRPEILSLSLVDILFHLDIADETQINNDYAVSLVERVAASLQRMDSHELSVFLDILAKSAITEKDDRKKKYLAGFPVNFGLRE